MLTVVSTASAEGFKQYGHRFLASFAQHWPSDVRLLFYTEGYPLLPNRAEVRDLVESSWLAEFKQKYRSDPRANGRGGYRWDAIRFAHKVAAILAADQICKDDYLLWLDADIITHTVVDHRAILTWSPVAFSEARWLSWLDRDPSVIGWPECGFLFFYRQYKLHRMAMMTMYDAYYSGRVLGFPETHDSYVWKWLVENLGLPARNLSGDGFKTMHPLINSPLGHWFDHLKGSRKLIGRSHPSDLVKPRDEPYWKERT